MPIFENKKGERKSFSKAEVGLKRKLTIDGEEWKRVAIPQPPTRAERLEDALNVMRDVVGEISGLIDEISACENMDEPFAVELKDKFYQRMQEIDFSIDTSEVESLRDEIENWKSGLEGTNLENSAKYEELGECYDALDNGIGSLEGLDFDTEIEEEETPNELTERLQNFSDELEQAISELEDVSFPRMF